MVIEEVHCRFSVPLPVQKGVANSETLEVEFWVVQDQFRQCWDVMTTVTFPGDEDGVRFQLGKLTKKSCKARRLFIAVYNYVNYHAF